MKSANIIKLLLLTFIIGNLTPAFAQKRSEKRGVSENGFNYEEEITSLSPGVSWFYNWGVNPSYMVEEVVGPDKLMEFYPMAWNGGFNEEKLREYLDTHPGVKYLLGYNEPNFKLQANMTPAEAAELWPVLEKIALDYDLELVAPALNYSPDAPYYNPEQWYDEFFELLPSDSKVDYLALHCYMISSESMMGFIDGIAEKYGKQVWLTEFCAWDNLTRDEERAREIQKEQMVRKVEALELSPNVAKYSWFKAKGADAYPYYPLLYYRNESLGIEAGTLTELGEIYVYMSSFDQNYYYHTEDKIPATNYVKSEYVTIERNTDIESPFRLQIASFGMYRSADYLIDVEEAGDYFLNIRIASRDSLENPFFDLYSDGEKIAGQELKETGSVDKWDIRSIPVNLSAGKQRLTVTSTKNTVCKVNWISLSKEDFTVNLSNEVYSAKEISIINKGEVLSVVSERPVREIVLMDMSGRVIKQSMGTESISTASVPQGVYLVKILLMDGSKCTQKCVVSNL